MLVLRYETQRDGGSIPSSLTIREWSNGNSPPVPAHYKERKMERTYSSDEIKGKLKPLMELLKQQPEATVAVINEYLAEEPQGINLFWKTGDFNSWGKRQKLKIGSSSA